MYYKSIGIEAHLYNIILTMLIIDMAIVVIIEGFYYFGPEVTEK